MKMEIIDTSNGPEMENIIVISPDEQKEINNSVIKIICQILFENGEITYEERKSIIRKASE